MKNNSRKLIIPHQEKPERLDLVLSRLLPDHSRNTLQKWIKDGHVLVNDETKSTRFKVSGREKLVVFPQVTSGTPGNKPENIELNVVYEDREILIINKPAGLVVHPGNGNWSGTLLNALLNHNPDLQNVPRAGLIHRLDKDTTGLLAVAKNVPAYNKITNFLQQRLVVRKYLAIVSGVLNTSDEIQASIARHPKNRVKMAVNKNGKFASTYYEPIKRGADWTLLLCTLGTGRTHQIRVHLAHIGHPLLGDPVYGRKNVSRIEKKLQENTFRRQALHATFLSFTHPQTGELMNWEDKLPDDMNRLLNSLGD